MKTKLNVFYFGVTETQKLHTYSYTLILSLGYFVI